MLEKLKKLGINTKSFWIVFSVIFVSNDTLLFGTNAKRSFFYLHIVILLFLFIYLCINSKWITQKKVSVALILSFIMFTAMIFNQDNEYIKYIYNIFMLFFSIVMVSSLKENTFVNMFINVMYVLALFSIFLFIVGFLFNPIYKVAPYITNESYLKYYFFGLGFLEDLPVGTIPRIYGIFREPGVFSCYLTLALIFELFLKKRIEIKKVLVFVISSFVTFSTAAYILIVLCIILYLFKFIFIINIKEKKKMFRILIIIILFILGSVGFVGRDNVDKLVFNKLYVENASRDSRFGSIETNISIFLTNPIIGKGWKFVEKEFNSFSDGNMYTSTHNTNTFLKLLAMYGLIPFSILILLLCIFFKNQTGSFFYGVVLSLIWIIALSNEDFTVNLLLYILPFYGLNHIKFR